MDSVLGQRAQLPNKSMPSVLPFSTIDQFKLSIPHLGRLPSPVDSAESAPGLLEGRSDPDLSSSSGFCDLDSSDVFGRLDFMIPLTFPNIAGSPDLKRGDLSGEDFDPEQLAKGGSSARPTAQMFTTYAHTTANARQKHRMESLTWRKRKEKELRTMEAYLVDEKAKTSIGTNPVAVEVDKLTEGRGRLVRKTSFEHTVAKEGIIANPTGRHQVDGKPHAPDSLVGTKRPADAPYADSLLHGEGGFGNASPGVAMKRRRLDSEVSNSAEVLVGPTLEEEALAINQSLHAEDHASGQIINAPDECIAGEEQEKLVAQTLVERSILECTSHAPDKVDQYEENNSEMEEQLQVDELETHLETLYLQDCSNTHRMRELSEELSKLCGKLGKLPTSYVIKVDFDWIDKSPHSHGGQSDVYRASYDGRLVAIKEHRWHVGDREVMKKAFCQEAVYWKRLRHPNIVPFLGIASSARFFFAMASEWMKNGDIIGYLKTNPSSNRLKMLADVSAAMAYMHANKVIHGDIKGRNVLVNLNGEACLSDFGLATAEYNTQSLIAAHSTAGVSPGTLRWSAPERLTHTEDPRNGRPTARGDTYSFGILMWEVYTLEVPFSHYRHDWALIPEIINGLRPDRRALIPEKIWSLMCQCWAPDPMARPCGHERSAYLSGLLMQA